MEVVDQIRWIPGFGYERELDWLLNMHDWMISKKRYWGLALPIYDCPKCGTFDVVGGREELRERAVAGWERFEGHTPHRPYVDEVVDRLPVVRRAGGADQGRRQPVAGRRDRAVLDASLSGRIPTTGRKWFPADFITESFPGQFRNWFYSMLAMSTVLRREPPFKTIFGYALVFGEDGRPMHKSWGNAIEFDEAAERMGVDVMRWLFAKARPEENILFGWHAADEARRELLVLWNVYAFFVTYARLAGWAPDDGGAAVAERPASIAGSCRRRRPAADGRGAARGLDAVGRRAAISTFIDDLSTWYLRLSRDGFSRTDDAADRSRVRDAPRRPRALSRSRAPILPFLTESMYATCTGARPRRPTASTSRAGRRRAGARPRRALEAAMATPGRRGAGPDAARLGRAPDAPAARPDVARPAGGACRARRAARAHRATRSTSRTSSLIGDESELVERRVKPLLPKIGRSTARRSPRSWPPPARTRSSTTPTDP
jgi:isoleucyl-tRNA synthetase